MNYLFCGKMKIEKEKGKKNCQQNNGKNKKIDIERNGNNSNR